MSRLSRIAFSILLITILCGSISCGTHSESKPSNKTAVKDTRKRSHKEMAILYLMDADESVKCARDSSTIVGAENYYLQEAQVFAAEAQVHATLHLAEVTAIR